MSILSKSVKSMCGRSPRALHEHSEQDGEIYVR